jgi:hypothetical protein
MLCLSLQRIPCESLPPPAISFNLNAVTMVAPPALPTWMKYIRGLFLGTMIVDEDKAEILPMLYDEEGNGCGGRYVISSFLR